MRVSKKQHGWTRRVSLAFIAASLMPIIFFRPAVGASEDIASTPVAALEEIVVTAQKRSSTVQSTPLSITAVSGVDIQSAGITNAQGLVQLAPGIAVSSAGPGQAIYEIRGLSTGNGAGGGLAPTIGFYLDETPLTPPANSSVGKTEIDPDTYDVARVEILRGPQGTLYGAGSMGGTIRIVTAPPDPSGFKGSAESITSGTKNGGINYAEKAMLNLPLAEKITLRIVGSYTHDSGWINRIVVPNFPLETNPSPSFYGTTRGSVVGIPGSQVFKNVNDANITSGRASLLIAPTDRLTITPSVFTEVIRQGGINAYDSDPGTLAHYQPFNVPEPFSDRITVSGLTINYDFDAFSITSATSYWTRHTSQVEDGTEVTQNLFHFPSYSAVGAVQAHEVDKTRQFTEELRLASRGDGPLKWLGGVYYAKYNDLAVLGDTAPGLLAIPGAPFPTSQVVGLNWPIEVSQKAVFGNLSYTLAKFTLTAGARYFSYSDDFTQAAGGILVTGSDATSTVTGAAKAKGTTPMLNLSYAPTENLLVYTSAAKGFREGGGNAPVPTTGPFGSLCLQNLEALGLTSAPSSYKPDTVWTYEVGEKGTLFDGRMTLNASVFYTRWSNVQQPVSLACGLSYVTNGADADVKGGEVELRARITDHFSVVQNVGYAYAAFRTNDAASGVTSGELLLDVPHWTIGTTLQYDYPIFDNRRFFAGITNSFQSSSYEITYARDMIPSRDLTNIRLGVDSGRWTAALFVNNAFNQIKPLSYQNLVAFTGPPYDRIAVTQPLTAGVDLSFKF